MESMPVRVDHSAQPDQLHNLRGLRAALLADLEPQITLALDQPGSLPRATAWALSSVR